MIPFIKYVDEEIDGKVYKVPFSCMEEVELTDFTNDEFDLDKWTERTGNKNIKRLILKQLLERYKQDVEQVELFNMQRDDYAEKKQMCASIILQLRELENSEV